MRPQIFGVGEVTVARYGSLAVPYPEKLCSSIELLSDSSVGDMAVHLYNSS